MGWGYEIRDPEKIYPESWVKNIPDPDPQHCCGIRGDLID